MTDATPCLLCSRRQPDTGHTCAPCFDRLAATLRDIQAEAELLSAVPSMAQASGTRGGTLASHRAPARLDALVLDDPRTTWDGDPRTPMGVLATLGSWARLVREDRALAWPEQVTVVSERKLLSVSLDWIAAQDWIDEFAAELRTLRGQLQRTNGTQPPKPVGRCYLPQTYAPGEANGTVRPTCDGPVWIDDAAGHAHCSWCRATWDGAALLLLKHEMDRQEADARRPRTHDGRPMYTADEMAQRLGTTANNIRVRAHRRGANGNGGWYDPAAFEQVSA